MAASDVEICNMALARIGVKAFISALGDTSVTAQVCNLWYEQARDFVQTDFEWQFAEVRESLAPVTAIEAWTYAYQTPSSMLKARWISDGRRNLPVEQRPPFRLIGSVLVADISPCTLVYTQRIENEDLFPTHFVDALTWRLAGEFLTALKVKTDIDPTKMYEVAKWNAAAIDQQQTQADAPPDASHILARL